MELFRTKKGVLGRDWFAVVFSLFIGIAAFLWFMPLTLGGPKTITHTIEDKALRLEADLELRILLQSSLILGGNDPGALRAELFQNEVTFADLIDLIGHDTKNRKEYMKILETQVIKYLNSISSSSRYRLMVSYTQTPPGDFGNQFFCNDAHFCVLPPITSGGTMVRELIYPSIMQDQIITVRLARRVDVSYGDVPLAQQAPSQGTAPPDRLPPELPTGTIGGVQPQTAGNVPEYGPNVVHNEKRSGTLTGSKKYGGNTYPRYVCSREQRKLIKKTGTNPPSVRPSTPPTFSEGTIRFTGYYTTTCEDFTSTEEFNKATRMEGSGLCRENGVLKHYKSTKKVINGEKKRVMVGTPTYEGDTGSTACGNDPRKHRTIAVNPIKGTPCYIPYGSWVYLEWPDNNPLNGWYMAQDTGGSFFGQCKIDVYRGVGKTEYKSQPRHAKYGKVWVIPPASTPPLIASTQTPGGQA